MSRKKGRPEGIREQTTVIEDDAVFFQPWYLPKDVYLQIRRLLPNAQLSKMRYYYEDYGCLKCSQKETIYGSNGLCERCTVLIRGRLQRSLKRRLNAVGATASETVSPTVLSDGIDQARSLLEDVRKVMERRGPQTRRRLPRGLIA
jgi:hypothetical protein